MEAAEAMLCLQVSSAAMRTLALGRGKIARGWEDLDAIHSVINQGELFVSDYRVSRVVAEAPVAPQDAAEDVQVDRLKLPQEAATVQLEDYLVDEDIRDGYLRPSTLTLADSEPFVGRACNRVRRAEFPKFIRALDERGMLAAVRRALGPHAGFFGIRKRWDESRGVWILRLVMDRRPRNAEKRKLVPSEDTVPHGSCFTDIVLEPGYILRVWSTDLPQYYYQHLPTTQGFAPIKKLNKESVYPYSNKEFT